MCVRARVCVNTQPSDAREGGGRRVFLVLRSCARVCAFRAYICISFHSSITVTVAHDEGTRIKHPLEFRYVRVDYASAELRDGFYFLAEVCMRL